MPEAEQQMNSHSLHTLQFQIWREEVRQAGRQAGRQTGRQTGRKGGILHGLRYFIFLDARWRQVEVLVVVLVLLVAIAVLVGVRQAFSCRTVRSTGLGKTKKKKKKKNEEKEGGRPEEEKKTLDFGFGDFP